MTVVLFAHDLCSAGGGSGTGRSEDGQRLAAAIKAFLACSTEVIAHLERRLLERRLGGGSGGERNRVVAGWRGGGLPFQQTEESVGGVLIASVTSQKAWKSLLCQLVKNLEWVVLAGSSLCVT